MKQTNIRKIKSQREYFMYVLVHRYVIFTLKTRDLVDILKRDKYKILDNGKHWEGKKIKTLFILLKYLRDV